jgi:hypothetical protein
MFSVTITSSFTPASIASNAASRANAGGTEITDASTRVFRTTCSTVS